MPILRGTRRYPILGGVGAPYARQVLATQPANLIGYWPLWEASGSVADNYEGTAARDGAYTGVSLGETGIGDGRTCPLFDGANDFCNVYTANFAAAFNGAECTIMMWLKVFDAGVWTDETLRGGFYAAKGTSDIYSFQKQAADNELLFRRRATGTFSQVLKSGISETGWMCLGMTASKTADEFKAYYNGAQEGSTQTGLGVFVGPPASDRTLIGAQYTTPSGIMYGWGAHVAVWTTPLTPAEMAALAVV